MKLPIGMVVVLAGAQLLCADEGPVPTVLRSSKGTMGITFNGKADHYYTLFRSLNLAEQGEPIEVMLGVDGPMQLKDRFRPTPSQVFYRVRELPTSESVDTDGDGRLDSRELRINLFDPSVTLGNALNPIEAIDQNDGTDFLTQERFDRYAVTDSRPITEGVTGKQFLKFVGLPIYDPGPAVLFMDTALYSGHRQFLQKLGRTHEFDLNAVLRGELAWIPEEGSDGWYTFNLQPGNAPTIEHIRFLYHALTKNMPFLDGNLAYRPIDTSFYVYQRDQQLYEREGIPIWLDDERLATNDYVPLNEGETYGLLNVFDPDERPSILDVALYRQLPNDVPILRGIITETPQTPLSHVNLRAVQNGNPNAYIREASTHPDVVPLIGKYVRYSVKPEGFELSQVTKEEVETHLEAIRPKEAQVPPRDLQLREIRPLAELGFEWSPSIGAKASNVAELMTSNGVAPSRMFPEMVLRFHSPITTNS